MDEDELGKELYKDLGDFPWEREAAWLRIEEALRRDRDQNQSAWESVSFDELKRRCREVFDACFFICVRHMKMCWPRFTVMLNRWQCQRQCVRRTRSSSRQLYACLE
jgi:hypothetical protein